MAISNGERRQIENEMIFRRANESVAQGIDDLNVMYIEDGNAELVADKHITLQFLCECSDENCDTRIPILLNSYQNLHADRSAFIIAPGHQVEAVEEVIGESRLFSVVKKYNVTSEPTGPLNNTPINNT